MSKLYKHRGYLISKNEDTGKWFAYGSHVFDNEFDTIEQAKNNIDKYLGGTPTQRVPKRWLNDEKLKPYYEGKKWF